MERPFPLCNRPIVNHFQFCMLTLTFCSLPSILTRWPSPLANLNNVPSAFNWTTLVKHSTHSPTFPTFPTFQKMKTFIPQRPIPSARPSPISPPTHTATQSPPLSWTRPLIRLLHPLVHSGTTHDSPSPSPKPKPSHNVHRQNPFKHAKSNLFLQESLVCYLPPHHYPYRCPHLLLPSSLRQLMVPRRLLRRKSRGSQNRANSQKRKKTSPSSRRRRTLTELANGGSSLASTA